MGNKENRFDDILDFIRKKNDKGHIVVKTLEGLISIPKDIFISQKVDGILYDLNRDEVTTLSLAKSRFNNERWINDLAATKTIRALKEKLDKYEEKYGNEI